MPKTFESDTEKHLYFCWSDLRKRCRGKEITICPAWEDFNVFREDVEESYRTGFSLDRIDGAGVYEPENCQWLSKPDLAKKSNKTKAKLHAARRLVNPMVKLRQANVKQSEKQSNPSA
jgi:hypothetical protein